MADPNKDPSPANRVRLAANSTAVFAVFCALEPKEQTVSGLFRHIHQNYTCTVTRQELSNWMDRMSWRERAKRVNEETHNAVATAVSNTKVDVIVPIVERMVDIEARGWLKIAESLDKLTIEDTKSFKAFADTMLSITKFRTVLEGGVSDRVGTEIRNMSDDELLREIDRLKNNLGINEDVVDLVEDEFAEFT